MKNKKLLLNSTRLNRAELDPALQDRIDADPALKAEWQSMQDTVNLVRLKRYEQPPSGTLENLAANISRQIRLLEPVEEKSWLGAPAVRYGLAAVFLGLLGIHLLSASSLPQADPISWGADAPLARTRPLSASLDDPGMTLPSTPVLPRMHGIYYAGVSNVAPATIQYGGQPSAVVEYDF